MRYGLPYQGSKNAIVPFVLSVLPPAETFVDLFAGGCAMTHGAIVSGKYRKFICNDITDAPKLFYDAVNGKFHDERRWISREDFFALKDTDPYIRLCWSFGNNQKSYLYSKEIEPWKKALHYARVFGDYSLLKEFSINSNGSRKDIIRNHEEYLGLYRLWYNYTFGGVVPEYSLESLQSLESLERLQSLQSLERLQSLTIMQKSYDEVEIPRGACVYCDPPYRGKSGYLNEFDFGAFDDWLREAKQPIYVSEYSMPEDFVEVERVRKRNIFSQTANNLVCEKIFVHERWAGEITKTTLF